MSVLHVRAVLVLHVRAVLVLQIRAVLELHVRAVLAAGFLFSSQSPHFENVKKVWV